MQAIGSIEGRGRARRFLTRAREKGSRDASDRTRVRRDSRSGESVADQRLDGDDALALSAGDLRPVVRVAGVRQVLVLLELLAHGNCSYPDLKRRLSMFRAL